MWKNQSKKQPISKISQKSSKGFFWATRNRILFGYAIILCFIFVVFVPAFREVLYARINSRVHRQVTEKMQIFKQLITGKTQFPEDIEFDDDNEAVNRLKEADNRLIKTPKTKEELRDFLDAFLGNQLPEDDTFLIMLWQGKFYKSSPRARPKELSRDSQIIRYWAGLTQSEQGEKVIPGSTIDSVIYLAEPVKINGEVMGVFVIAHATSGERKEVLEAVVVIIQVSIVVLLSALVLAWIASGKILAPLNLLTQTARKISETDLNQRITINGEGELAELAATFNEMMDRLQAAFISQRNFINDAGHELRTPITIIRGHLELMGDDPQEIQETLALVMDELERMNRFVNDLLLLAKAEQPDFLQLEIVDVRTFTEELFAKIRVLGDELRPTADNGIPPIVGDGAYVAKARCNLGQQHPHSDRNWHLEAIARGKIVADRQRLTQAVMNLAQNATQHTNNTDTIALGSMIHQGTVSFWVRDTGEGIAQADQQRIFQRFARATNSRRRSEGAGLGLSIVQAIAEAHGGQVTLKSQLGKGAIFTIILPLEPSQEEQ